MSQSVLILGTSCRAAAFSARRVGMRPLCGDLFADGDLAAICPARAVEPDRYPEGLKELADRMPEAPWMYTGAWENYPELVQSISTSRTLWGNPSEVIEKVRRPDRMFRCLQEAGLSALEVRLSPEGLPRDGSWLCKPIHGGCGAGISPWVEKAPICCGQVYFQKRMEGPSCSAIYVANGRQSVLIGVSEQLVGTPFTHAKPFAYGGSVAPMTLRTDALKAFKRIGAALAATFGLRGLFGVDAIFHAGLPWAVEINPRYTASVEVHELRLGIPLLNWHATGARGDDLHELDQALKETRMKDSYGMELRESGDSVYSSRSGPFLGKAILFAPAEAEAPDLSDLLPDSIEPWSVPAAADIPRAGTILRKGAPVMTLFCRGPNREGCLGGLRRVVAWAEERIFGKQPYESPDCGAR